MKIKETIINIHTRNLLDNGFTKETIPLLHDTLDEAYKKITSNAGIKSAESRKGNSDWGKSLQKRKGYPQLNN